MSLDGLVRSRLAELSWCADGETLPPRAGAYLLRLQLDRTVELDPPFAGLSCGPGTYVYAGSAWGPGGIRARCRHHLRQPRRRHWHIDRLTAVAAALDAAAFPGVSECDLARCLIDGGASIPVPRFGSSDCTVCPAHLVAVANKAGELCREWG